MVGSRGARRQWSMQSVGALAIATVLFVGGSSPLSATISKDARPLFTIVRTLTIRLTSSVPEIAASDATSVFLTGTFSTSSGVRFTLLRIDRSSMKVVARSLVPNETSVAYGDHALWWATGSPLGTSGRTSTPDHGRELLKLDPTNLRVLARFHLPGQTLLVAVAAMHLWVATPSKLLQIDPSRGAVMVTVPLHYQPVALTPGAGGRFYVLGGAHGHLILADYSATSGHRIALRRVSGASSGPLAVTPFGVWLVSSGRDPLSATLRNYAGPDLNPGPSLQRLAVDVVPYAGASALWLIDAAGVAPTVCADLNTARVRATGSPLGVAGGLAVVGTNTYVLRATGTRASLAQITPAHVCSSASRG